MKDRRFQSVPRIKLQPSYSIEKMNSYRNSPRPNETIIHNKTASTRHISKLAYNDVWKADRVIKYITYKILEKGRNIKTGLETIYIFHNLKLYTYYIPIYFEIYQENEIILDFVEQQLHLKQLLHLKEMPKIWTLDGCIVKSFYKPFCPIFYIGSQFDFWEQIRDYNGYKGKFQIVKFNQLLNELTTLDNYSKIEDYFLKPSKLRRYFFYECQTFSLPYIQTDTKILLTEEDLNKVFLKLEPDQKKARVSMIEELMIKQISKPSSIKQQSMRLISLPFQSRTRDAIEKQILNNEISDPAELCHTTREYVEQQHLSIPTTRSPPSRLMKREVHHPFQLRQVNDPSLIQMVNIDKIQMDFNIQRRDVINYLTIFKCLMDKNNSEKDLLISKRNVLVAFPYLSMEGCKCSYDTYLKIKHSKQKYFTFEEFLEIFTKEKVRM